MGQMIKIYQVKLKYDEKPQQSQEQEMRKKK